LRLSDARLGPSGDLIDPARQWCNISWPSLVNIGMDKIDSRRLPNAALNERRRHTIKLSEAD
jgi:hypothetical protein